uniref:DUF4371 domain-containing protein n=1 Tax=Trichuris muris TaxID=70415 RepID=A0A5S6QGT5_TRIMR
MEGYFKEKEIPLTNVISVATDGAPSMVGCQRAFISCFKKVVPEILAIRCVIHRQHLVAKSLNERLHHSLQLLTTALCEENGKDFHHLLLHAELQGDDLNLIETKSVISAFVSKLLFYKHNLFRGEFYNFPNLCESCFTKTSSNGSWISFLWRSQIGS